MASEVDIANLALSHLGDSATVASLTPPEGSSQAEHCARWYPIARNALLAMHDWGFNTARVQLAQITQPWTEWQFAYTKPTDSLRILAILPQGATADYSSASQFSGYPYSSESEGAGFTLYTPQPFTTETTPDGVEVIYTNTQQAVARYTRIVTDTNRFSPLFVVTLARYLASYLAGPVVKGDTGIAIGQQQLQIAMGMMRTAAVVDANSQHQPSHQAVSWLAGR